MEPRVNADISLFSDEEDVCKADGGEKKYLIFILKKERVCGIILNILIKWRKYDEFTR